MSCFWNGGISCSIKKCTYNSFVCFLVPRVIKPSKKMSYDRIYRVIIDSTNSMWNTSTSLNVGISIHAPRASPRVLHNPILDTRKSLTPSNNCHSMIGRSGLIGTPSVSIKNTIRITKEVVVCKQRYSDRLFCNST